MSDVKLQQRKFIVKAGMTADDIKNSKDATVLQKKYASAFDTDGKKGFSQKEADLFNATTFAEKADGTVTFWTRQKDGTKKGTKFNIKDSNTIQFKSDEDVKPYIKKVTVKKAAKKKPDEKKDNTISFFDDKWSGEQVRKLGFDDLADWLQDKDKVCTDKKDDGKIGFWEGAKSLAKGLIGGIPKEMINHPVTTAVTVAAGAAAVAVTGGAILPVLGAAGAVTGIGMAGYSGYKAATAKTDGETKQALETLGMGVATTALSALSAGKTLDTAYEAGVESAHVSNDAGIWTKTVQMFKSVPEALKVSYDNAKLNVSSLFISESSAQSLANQKARIQNQIRRAVAKNVNSGKLNKNTYNLSETKQITDLITEDNIDFATKLMDPKVGYKSYSIYTKSSEDNCEYLLKTVPRLLRSNDPNVRRAAEYIIDSPEIPDKMFTLQVLNEENASEIMSLRGVPFKEFQCTMRENIPFDELPLQLKLWQLYAKNNNSESLLPFIEDSSNGTNYIKIYAEKGTIPNIPGIKTEISRDIYGNITDVKYVLYENTSSRPNDLLEAQNTARNLLKQYGFKTGIAEPVFENNAQKYQWLISKGCRTIEDKQWLADYIMSDEYKLVK